MSYSELREIIQPQVQLNCSKLVEICSQLDAIKLQTTEGFDDLYSKLANVEQLEEKSAEVYPVYDYEELKSNRAELHQEFRRMFKVFARSIRTHYDVPVAVVFPCAVDGVYRK